MTSKRAPGKIVIVSQYYAPDLSTTATYLTAIADGLKTDCEVLVIWCGGRSPSRCSRSECLVAKVIRFANGLLFPSLDAIITIGRDVEALLLTYKSVASRKIKFVPNWALLPIGYRKMIAGNSFRRRFAYKLVVGLSGNLGFTHSASTVYEGSIIKG